MSQPEALTKPAPLSRCPLTMVPGMGERDRTQEELGAHSRFHKCPFAFGGSWGAGLGGRAHPTCRAIWSQALALALAARVWPEL